MSKSKYEFQHNLTVVIGINNYSNGIPELETPVADAEELAKILKENYEYDVLKLLDEKATLEELNSLLEGFKQNTLRLPDKTVQVEENDRFIFYFAGHGIVPADGLENTDNLGGYLVPQDARGDILLQKQVEINKILLPMQALNDALAELPCRHMLVILDCCFAGAFRSSLYRDIVPARKVYKQRYDRFIRDPAWQAIASAAHDQKAIDYLGCFGQRGKIGKHSPFAEALFEGLRGEADTTRREGDGIITATELYCYVRDKVEELTDEHNRRQTPGLFPLKKHDKGEYIFLLPNFDQDKLENAPALNEENNPYRGLKSYEEENSRLFFGRDELVKELYARVCKPENPLTVVLGVSGSGKSSLVKAGLIPYLRENHAKEWYIIPTIRPGESPFAAMAKALVGNTEIDKSTLDAINSLSETLKQAPRQFIDVIANWRQIPANTKLLLVIDQFEELITICKQQEREQFLNFLAQALAAHSHQLHVILTLRLDFESRFLDSALKSYLTGARFPVRAMRSDELRQAIERPASEKMLDFKPPNLVDLLIDEVGQMPGALSLLSFTLSELYIKCIEQESRTLTEADYKDLGGVAGSLTHRATEVYNKLDSTQQTTMQRVMLRMVTIEGGESARRRVPESELVYAEDAENQRVKEILKRLDEARLIVGGRETGGEPYVEPAHDALVRGWNKLQEWKNEQQENLVLQQRLTPAANDWDQNRPTGLLLPDGDRLNQLEKILALSDNWLNQREREFIKSSIEYRDIQLAQAKELRVKAQLRQKAAKVQDLLPVQPLEGLVLAIQAMGQNLEELPNEILSPVQSSLHQAMEIAKEQNILLGHQSSVNSVAISPDGQYIVSGSEDKTVRLWDIYGNPLGNPFIGHEDGVTSIAISLDGEYIVSGSFDGTVRLWDIRGNQIQIFPGHEESQGITSVAISSDAQYIVSSSYDKTVRLWNRQGKLIGQPLEHEDVVTSVAISPNGQYIVSGSRDFQMRLWNRQGQQIGQPLEHDDMVSSVAISYDGQYIVSGSWDGTLRLWKINGDLIGEPFQGHENGVFSVALSSDGKYIVSGGEDKTVRFWDTQGKEICEPLRGHSNYVKSVAISPNQQYIVSGSEDKTVRLWDTRGNQIGQPFRGHKREVKSVAISQDRQYIVSISNDNTLRLWDEQGNPVGQAFKEEENKEHLLKSVAISPDGKYIVTGSEDTTVRLWDMQGNQISQPLRGHDNWVNSVAISLDGRYIVSGSEDTTVRVWDLRGKQIGQPFQGHQGAVYSVAISSDGEYIVSGGEDTTVRLWDIHGNPQGQPFLGHDNGVTSVAMSLDGQYIVSGSKDTTIRLWDIHGNPQGQPFQGHNNWVNSVAISPDGRYIVSGGEDATIRLWDIHGDPIGQPFRGHKGSVYSVAISTDKLYILSGGFDGTVRLWRFGNWETWLQIVCERLRYHPVFKNLHTEEAQLACETCQKYV